VVPQKFGGIWTEQKLDALAKYLEAYLQIFTTNPKATHFTRHYVDAFAGSGLRQIEMPEQTPSLDIGEAIQFMDGSVRKVLSMNQEFHHYWFVEKNHAHATELEQMIATDFPERMEQCHIKESDANEFLQNWADSLSNKDRAVVFIDPYDTAVKWNTIEKLAETQKVDLWMLFPSSGVIRMLPKSRPPEESWARRLTELFGDNSWRNEFYSEDPTGDLFDDQIMLNVVSEKTVADYLLRRLKEIFVGVVKRPLVLYNSKDSPLFMLVFAAGNPKGAATAVGIAEDIIHKK